MTNELDESNAGGRVIEAGSEWRSRRIPPFLSCKYCGCIATPMAILDSRQGKHYRLVRCAACERMSWDEER